MYEDLLSAALRTPPPVPAGDAGKSEEEKKKKKDASNMSKDELMRASLDREEDVAPMATRATAVTSAPESEIRDDKGNLVVAPNASTPSGGTANDGKVSGDAAVEGINNAAPLDERAQKIRERTRLRAELEEAKKEEMIQRLESKYSVFAPEGATYDQLKKLMLQSIKQHGVKGGDTKRKIKINGQQWKPDLAAAAEKTAAYERGRIAAQYGVDDETARLIQRQRHDSSAYKSFTPRENYNLNDALFDGAQNQVPIAERVRRSSRDIFDNALYGE
jgi:hypothetical protein